MSDSLLTIFNIYFSSFCCYLSTFYFFYLPIPVFQASFYYSLLNHFQFFCSSFHIFLSSQLSSSYSLLTLFPAVFSQNAIFKIVFVFLFRILMLFLPPFVIFSASFFTLASNLLSSNVLTILNIFFVFLFQPFHIPLLLSSYPSLFSTIVYNSNSSIFLSIFS